MSEEDESQKTEEPTQRRLEDAIKKGNILQSKEVMNFFVILSLLIVIVTIAPIIAKNLTFNLRKYIEMSYQYSMNSRNLGNILVLLIKDFVKIVIAPLLITSIAVILSYFLQQGKFIVSSEPLKPKISKISPFAGFKRLFSMKSFMEFIKGLLKITIVSLACYFAVINSMPAIKQLHSLSMAGILAFLLKVAIKAIIAAVIVIAFIAALDYFYQRYEYYKSLKMSIQDIKDEYKSTEGNPEIKAKLRKLRMEKSKERMMSAVPDSDVIITNPTHFSVALKYDPSSMEAPIVVAKGQDNIALRMREIAKDNDVMIYESPPLARVLFATVDIDDQVPIEHYKSVAEIIKIVFEKKKNGHLQAVD